MEKHRSWYKKLACAILLTGFSISAAFADSSATVSLDQKIGQMIMIGFDGTTLTPQSPVMADIQNQRIGGVVLFDYNMKTKDFHKNIENPAQLSVLTQQLQTATQRYQPSTYPLFIAIDAEGGNVNRLKPVYGFPKMISAKMLGKLPVAFTYYYAGRLMKTLNATGINLDFAPVIDLDLNPNSSIIGKVERSFSDNPMHVVNRAEIFSKFFKHHHILCAYKHFPGLGNISDNPHDDMVDETATWHTQELLPYEKLFANPNACSLVMVSHVINNQLDPDHYPASLSHKMITSTLRDQLHFNGVVITDDMQMGAIIKHYGLEKAIRLSINAGADIILFGNQLQYQPDIAQQVIQIVKTDIQKGLISEKRIDESYVRIMKAKAMLPQPNVNLS